MDEREALARAFEAERPRLRSVATRMLGAGGEAEDAVQEAWLRLARSGSDRIENLAGWLTTVVARVCLDQLRSRATRREEPIEQRPELSDPGADPVEDAVLADSVGAALLLVLDTLSPNERLALVLHDMFGVSFAEVAGLLDVTPEAARQYASRGRRRVRGADPDPDVGAPATPDDVRRQREVVAAFFAASKSGDFEALVRLMAPDVVWRADPAAVAMGAEPVTADGPPEVAAAISGRAKAARIVLLDGVPGAVWSHRGVVQVAFVLTYAGDLVSGIELVADRDRLDTMVIGRLG